MHCEIGGQAKWQLAVVKCTPMILGERVAAGGQLLVLSKFASHVGHMCD